MGRTKIVCIVESGVGKTSLLRQISNDTLNEIEFDTTFGTDFISKTTSLYG
jgi:GTPase SAR1 family protein